MRVTVEFTKKIGNQLPLIEGELIVEVKNISLHGKTHYAEIEIAIVDVTTREPLIEIETLTVYPGDIIHLRDIQEAFKINIS